MKDISFVAVTRDKVEELCSLAESIWRQHFTAIIGKNQVDYMLDKFQSPHAIADQLQSGYEYYFFQKDGKNIGYTGIHREDGALFLSKLYVRKEERGNGYARLALNYLEEICRNNHLQKIWLTVNKHNTDTIAIYKKMGFETVTEQKADIGGGFFMDDYIMEKAI